jgi:ubiquinone/menaquinone biosynthesis C-methylase UbiE
MHDPLLTEQVDYYRARAPEYDEWFLRLGRYDMGAAENARWFAEVEQVKEGLDAFGARGRVLELAGGTGFWTQHLARSATELTVLDAAPETLEINRQRVADPRVRYVVADLFSWQPDQPYDVVAFTFFLSHVPPERFADFWSLVQRSLAPGGRAFFVDSLDVQSTAFDHREMREGDVSVIRKLKDGRQFHIYKLFYAPSELKTRLTQLGWQTQIEQTNQYFIYGYAEHTPV